MFKKIFFLSPILNKKIAFLFSVFFLANSLYYSYHAVFTPFVAQAVNCPLIYIVLIVLFFLLSFFCCNEIEWKKIAKTFVLILLPSAVVIAIGYIKYPENFDKNARLFATLVIVAGSFILFLKSFNYKKIEDFFAEFSAKKSDEDNKRKKKGNFLIGLIIFLVLVFNLGFGLYHLAEFAAVDEPLWIFDRIPKFWSNVFDGEWHKTRISDKPGITVALISGLGTFWLDPSVYQSIHWQGEVSGPIENIKKMNFALRFPIFIFNALSLVLFFFLLKKLLGRFVAVTSVIFMGLSPILLGISRIINPDSLFWVFSALSLLSYFVFLKNSEKRYIFFTGIFLGLSLLTKYVANFFFVFYFAMIFINYILNRKDENWKEHFKKYLGYYGAIIYLSLLTFFILLPAAWVDLGRITEGSIFSEVFLKFLPVFLAIILLVLGEIYLLKGKISSFILGYLSGKKDFIIKIVSMLFLAAIISTAVNTWFGMKWLNFEKILASPKSSKTLEGFSGLIFSDFYSLIFGIHPLAFIFIIVLLAGIILGYKKTKQFEIWPIYIIIFIILYYLAYVIDEVGATVRYQILIYPLAFILASLGLQCILSFTRCKGRFCFLALAGLLFLLLIVSLNEIKPFYFSYASDFLPKKYILNLKDMGDGSYEAAQYLNSLDNAKELIVWTDKKGVCSFFVGKCFSDYRLKSYMKIDYFVVSANREARTMRQVTGKGEKNDYEISVDKLYQSNDCEYKLEIGGRPSNFVKVFSYARLIDGAK